MNGDAAPVRVRRFDEHDLPAVLAMMKALAEFEGYIADFRVTAQAILERGWLDDPSFLGLVAEDARAGRLVGMAIAYLVPFSYDLRPVAVLKELYVGTGCRGGGAGTALFHGVADWARRQGCAKLRWDVLQDNARAKRFYESVGGQPFSPWESWVLKFG